MSTKVDEILTIPKSDMNSAYQDRASSDVRDLRKDALLHNLISEILPGISKLNFSGILLAIYTKVDDIFLF